MVDFNNTLESAVKSVLKWEEKQIITETTIIRDVQGKVSLFLKVSRKQRKVILVILRKYYKTI